jgi:prolyl oligopeptidase
MKTLIQSLILFFLFISFTASSSIDENEKFLSFLEKEWQWELEQNPVYATAMGVKGFETQWPDNSLKGIKLREAHIQDSLVELQKYDSNKLNKTNQLNLRLYTQLTQTALNISEYNRYLFPFNHRGGVQLAHEAAESLPLKTLEDYRFWIERLKNLDKRIEQTISIARLGLEKNYKAPKVLMERVYRQIKIQSRQNVEDNPFYQVFKELPSTISLEDQKALRKNARQTIKDKIIPSYKVLEEFFRTEYLPQTRLTVGLYDTPKGKELYEQLAKSFTTTNLTPSEIHNIGLREVARIRGEMEEVIKEVRFEGSFKEFLVFLREDKRFYYDTAEELFEGYLAVSKRIDPELVALFGTLPRTPYGLRPIPMESAPDTTTAYYMPPAPGGLRPGYYYVNLYKPETRPKYEMEVLSVHEAVPGHHLQISLAMEKEDMPMFRRVSPYTAFVEGWGLYSESLGYELGLYTDPYSRFGQLTYDMWRAVRLVVDTGMHYFEWERQKAIDYFLENAAKSELDIINEIDRYIVMPGQALAYKIGQMKFAALKETARKELGVKFDVRKFHDLVLSEGAIPLNELDTLVENYIRLESEKD